MANEQQQTSKLPDWNDDEAVVRAYAETIPYYDVRTALPSYGGSWSSMRKSHKGLALWEAAHRPVEQNEPAKVLMSCPFCDGKGEFGVVPDGHGDDSGGRFIQCANCGASTSLFFALKESVSEKLSQAWNKRVSTPVVQTSRVEMSAESSYAQAVDLAGRLDSPDAEKYAKALGELRDLIESARSIPLIQQNANDNYAASEARLHAAEEEAQRLRVELAKDDDLMFDAAMKQASEKSISKASGVEMPERPNPKDFVGDGSAWDFYTAMGLYADALERENAKLREGGWISVSVLLPEPRRRVLTFSADGVVRAAVYAPDCTCDFKWHDNDRRVPTHWQLQPAAPETKESKS